jgi:hypothetical protein
LFQLWEDIKPGRFLFHSLRGDYWHDDKINSAEILAIIFAFCWLLDKISYTSCFASKNDT